MTSSLGLVGLSFGVDVGIGDALNRSWDIIYELRLRSNDPWLLILWLVARIHTFHPGV